MGRREQIERRAVQRAIAEGSADLTAHEAAADPHPGYALESALGTMAAVNDAPSDGTTYGRKNGAWEAASGGSGLAHPQVMARAAWGF